jgi:uncharacterized glyoxalase superfamily protein PhnB
MQRIIPMIAYEDAAGAIEFLERAFGFRERKAMRFTDADGRISHAELALGDEIVMLATPAADYESPRRHREHCAEARAWSSVPYVIDGVLVEIDGVDAHFAHAKAAGANVLSQPEDVPEAGIRHYRVEDIEGHRWMFSQPIAVAASR